MLTWFARRRTRRRFRTATAYAIGELPEDTVGKISGAAQPVDGVLEAPLSKRACLLYVVEIYHFVSEHLPPRKVFTEQRGVPFVLEREGARAIVDPTDAIVSITFDRSELGRPVFGNDRHAALLKRNDLWDHKWPMIFHLEYREAVIEPGKNVAVVGSGTREPDPRLATTGLYREGGGTQLRLTSSATHPLAITDDARSL